MSASRRHAEIAGAGFAGLAAGIALARRGWSVRVHERAPALRAFGAGIFIWENGLRVLEALGARGPVAAGAHEAMVYEIRDRRRVVERTRFSAATNDRMLTMTRQTLYAALLAAAERAGVETVTGSEAVGAEPDGVLVTAGGGRFPADLVVGADGVRSRVRDSLGIRARRRTGTLGLLRVMAPRCLDALGPGPWDRVLDVFNLSRRRLRVLYVPCNADELYLALMAPVDDAEATAVPARPEVWVPAFPEFAAPLRRLAADGRYDAYETVKLSRWSRGRVAILGDSAHAMVPSLGQGAGMAMANALALAVALDETPDVADALERWEARERPATEYVQDRSARAARERMRNGGRIWSEATTRPARAIPTGTEHLPRILP